MLNLTQEETSFLTDWECRLLTLCGNGQTAICHSWSRCLQCYPQMSLISFRYQFVNSWQEELALCCFHISCACGVVVWFPECVGLCTPGCMEQHCFCQLVPSLEWSDFMPVCYLVWITPGQECLLGILLREDCSLQRKNTFIVVMDNSLASRLETKKTAPQ